jgi:hypothetical protein
MIASRERPNPNKGNYLPDSPWPWVASCCNCRLITLLDMKHYFAKRLVALSECLATIHFYCIGGPKEKVFPHRDEREHAKKSLHTIIEEAKFMGLKMTQIYAERCLSEIDSIAVRGQLQEMSKTLEGRFNDELESITFFFIPHDKLDYYHNPNLFGEKVVANFPAANHEASESGKCFATARYTATVFHLMRVLEVALKAIAKGLAIPDPTKNSERNWGKILKKIKDEIDTKNSKTPPDPAWLNDKDFFEKSYAYLEGARNPWRNATMHVEANYDEQGALDIFNATGALMRHLATKLIE